MSIRNFECSKSNKKDFANNYLIFKNFIVILRVFNYLLVKPSFNQLGLTKIRMTTSITRSSTIHMKRQTTINEHRVSTPYQHYLEV